MPISPRSIANFKAHFVSFFVETVPRNLLSYVVGWIVRLRLPSAMAYRFNQLFVDFFRIDMSEAEKDLREYRTIEDVFTRRLKAFSRSHEGPVQSPADGMLSYSAAIDAGSALQAKGFPYPVSELVFGIGQNGKTDVSWDPAWAMTVYLAPHNYHRTHFPVGGILRKIRYIPGDLWPVNETFVHKVPRLFVKNERLVFQIDLTDGGRVDAVMVGALNVGRMETPFLDHFASNDTDSPAKATTWDIDRPIKAGDEMGTFLLGSTVVLIFDRIAKEKYSFVQTFEKKPIMTGQDLTVFE